MPEHLCRAGESTYLESVWLRIPCFSGRRSSMPVNVRPSRVWRRLQVLPFRSQKIVVERTEPYLSTMDRRFAVVTLACLSVRIRSSSEAYQSGQCEDMLDRHLRPAIQHRGDGARARWWVEARTGLVCQPPGSLTKTGRSISHWTVPGASQHPRTPGWRRISARHASRGIERCAGVVYSISGSSFQARSVSAIVPRCMSWR